MPGRALGGPGGTQHRRGSSRKTGPPCRGPGCGDCTAWRGPLRTNPATPASEERSSGSEPRLRPRACRRLRKRAQRRGGSLRGSRDRRGRWRGGRGERCRSGARQSCGQVVRTSPALASWRATSERAWRSASSGSLASASAASAMERRPMRHSADPLRVRSRSSRPPVPDRAPVEDVMTVRQPLQHARFLSTKRMECPSASGPRGSPVSAG
jgi:hypothetical protein